MRSLFFFGGLVSCAALFAFACGPPDDDNTVYGPPDAGQPDADYCVSDFDCPPDDAGNQLVCGFPISDRCEARGICVVVNAGSAKCPPGNYCGCNGEVVSTCPITDTSYVRGGPTTGSATTALPDGGVSCSN